MGIIYEQIIDPSVDNEMLKVLGLRKILEKMSPNKLYNIRFRYQQLSTQEVLDIADTCYINNQYYYGGRRLGGQYLGRPILIQRIKSDYKKFIIEANETSGCLTRRITER